MPRATIRPPFAWAGPYTAIISLIAVVLVAAFFRFYELNTLPPGLHDHTATLALQAVNLAEHGQLPGLNAANGYAPLLVWLQALPIKLLGHTELALRLWPALLGTLAVLATWLWARSWFGVRIAWLSAFLMAVTPWAVALSRHDLPMAILPLLVTLTLWLATRAWRVPGAKNILILTAVLALDLLSGPLGWLLAAVTLVTGVVHLARRKHLIRLDPGRAVGLGVLMLALGGLVYFMVTSWSALAALPQAAGLTANPGTLFSNLVKTLLMFNVRGDESYHHNLSGEPMLNVFVGIMLVAGLLVSISRLHQLRYRVLLLFTLIFLVPAIITIGAPNAARAVIAMPLILTLSAIGISYLLELWYATFPINSAARAVGQSAIILLLILTAYQGYTQYFRAWAGSNSVYAAYNEAAREIAHHIPGDKFSGQRYVVATAHEQPVVAFLHPAANTYQLLEPSGIAGLPVAATPRLFYISSEARDEAVKTLKVKFPGGVLRPHYSSFNQAEIYYTYEITK